MTAPALSSPTDPRVRHAIDALVTRGTLTPGQADEVVAALTTALAAPPAPSGRHRLAEVAGYVGGALTAGAVILFLSQGWNQLERAGQVLLLAVTAVLLLLAGAWVGRLRSPQSSPARRRLASTLWTIAAATAAGAAGTGVPERPELAAAAVGLAVAGAAYALAPTALGQLATWLASIGLVTSLVALLPAARPWEFGLVLLALGIGWALLALRRLVERQLGLALGTAAALFGAQLPVFDETSQVLAYALTAALALACFGSYLAIRSWALLAGGVIAVTLVVPEAIFDWTDGSLSSAGVLLAAGLSLLAASAVGLQLRRGTAQR